jgi:hypothetical protein
MELCGRGQTIPEPDRLGQSVGSAPICLRPPILPPSMGCQPGPGLGPIRGLRRHTVRQAVCIHRSTRTQVFEAKIINGLYTVSDIQGTYEATESQPPIPTVQESGPLNETEAELWHRQLTHSNYKNIQRLQNASL